MIEHVGAADSAFQSARTPAATEKPPCWHALSADAVLAGIGALADGLSSAEAAARLSHFGLNALPVSARKSWQRRFMAQFDNLLIYVLIGSALITGILGHAVDTGVIVGVVIINAVFGVLQEGKAERALEAIRSMVSPKASVLRDGRRMAIDAADHRTVALGDAGECVAHEVHATALP
jgi:magnesium-transporting ATPase (P-type)